MLQIKTNIPVGESQPELGNLGQIRQDKKLGSNIFSFRVNRCLVAAKEKVLPPVLPVAHTQIKSRTKIALNLEQR